MKVSIIGQGYVGQTLAIGAAKSGYEVIGLDLNTKIISYSLNPSLLISE